MDRIDLPLEAVSINGQYIEDAISGYKTIITSGREGLTAELNTYSVGSADGETVKGSRIPIREITVEFAITATSMESLRAKLEHLNNLLSVGEADFVFNDESDRYYTGIPLISTDFKSYKNAATGSYKIYCAYPFKRSVNVITLSSTDESGVELDDSSATFTFNYNGSYPARPLLRAEFAGALSGGDYSDDGDCGFVAFLDSDENIIQLGNPDAIDLDEYTSAEQLINHTFANITGWNISGNVATKNITDRNWNKGKGQTMSYAYNTSSTTNTSTLYKTVSDGAVDFSLALVHRLCAWKPAETGTFECGAYAGNVMTAGFRVKKTANGTTAKVEYVLNGVVKGTDNIDLAYVNTNFGYCNKTAVYTAQKYSVSVWKKVGRRYKWVKETKTRNVRTGWKYTQSNLNSSIKKSGSTVTFKVGNLAAKTLTSSDIDLTVSTQVKFTFTAGKTPLHTNAVNSVRFTKEPSKSFADIPNVFTAGDIVEADCNDASVSIMHEGTVEGHIEPQYGALGNDWEDFVIKPGQNVIRAVWSSWVNAAYKPTIRIIFNEVYL